MEVLVWILFFVFSALYFVFALKKREWAVVMLPLFFPFYLWKISVAGIPFTLIESFIAAVFLALIFHVVFYIFSPKKWWDTLFTSFVKFVNPKRSFWSSYKAVLIPVGLIILGALLSLAVTKRQMLMVDGTTIFESMRIALGIFKSWIIVPILFFLLVLAGIDRNKHVLNLFNSYTISSVIIGLWGIFQLLTNNFITADARASGPFESANYLALYIGPALLYSLIRTREVVLPFAQKIRLMKEKTPAEKPETLLFLFASIVLLLALFATKSYAGIIAVFVATVFYFGAEYFEYLRKNRDAKIPWKFIFIVAVSVILFSGAIYLSDPAKLRSAVNFSDRNSSTVRIEVYQISTELIKHNLFFGIGMGQFPAYYQVNASEILHHSPFEWNMLHPHNLFLAVWLNLGLVGLVGFIWLLVLVCKKCFPAMKNFANAKIYDGNKIRMIAFSLLLVILIHGFFDTPFFKNDLSLIFWTVVGVIFATDNERNFTSAE